MLVLYSRTYYANTGAKSWFSLFGLTFQPSEVMKPAYILMMGRVIVQHNDNYPIRTVRSDFLLIG
ncbi:FtsW/RodA/SpoVE family cell cycle protein, partial [Staphylococcus haemolyticus]|uniref:FtsW/RodA/SpoVE family cell cycle protein n=1 Tax=Staphylococcus haemolyticus TaxID=1283 RepID=UPI0027E2B408